MNKKENVIGLWIFLLFLSVFLLISNGRFGGDGLENYLTAESIVLDRDFSIHDRPFGIPQMRCETRGNPGPNGKIYSSYGLGMAFLLVPLYFVGHIAASLFTKVPHDYITQFFVSLTNPAMLAMLAAALFIFLRRLGYSLRISLSAVSIYSLCTINVVYARSGFAEPTVALLITLAALALFSYSRHGRLSSLITAGICVGYTIFIKKNSLILLPAFLYYLLALTPEGTKKHVSFSARALYFLLPIAFFVIVIIFQNKILYGGISKTEFGSVKDMLGHVVRKSFPVKGLYYYLISAGKGYLIYNIALILGVFAVRDFFKKNKQLCLFLIFLLLSNLLFYSFIFTRGSIFSWGPRYLFPTMPFMTLFLAEFINKGKTMARKIPVLFFASLGFIIQLPSLIINFSNYIFFVKEKLMLPEYFMDFMPELSPIKGAWMLLVSLIKRCITGESSLFLYNPDFRFISPLSVSLKGYDAADIWWINMVKVNVSLAPYAAVGIIIFIVLAIFSYKRVSDIIKNNPNA